MFKSSLKVCSTNTPLNQFEKLIMQTINKIGSRIILTNFLEAIKRSSFSETGLIGQQIINLALSVKARIDGVEPGTDTWPADGYQGDYIKDVACVLPFSFDNNLRAWCSARNGIPSFFFSVSTALMPT